MFEISYTPPTDSECSPAVPRICKLYLAATASNLALSADNFGKAMWTDALIVVPKLVGQKVKKPKRSSRENGTLASICLTV